ncbi:MAG: ferredoxin [Microbacteriaceae bacterium]
MSENTTTPLRVAADRSICVGAGQCVRVAAAVFDQDDDALVTILMAEVPAELQAAAREAVELCPSGAITIVET